MGDCIMSETQYDKLLALMMEIKNDVGDLGTRLAIVATTVRDYDKCVDQIADHGNRIGQIEKRCNGIQEEKKNRKPQLGALKTGIIVGIVVGIVVSLINLILSHL
jgi:tetrahydromethanopterin S-methyltransferase subunit G